ncbi:right-handed parallel beta-helix repeat-containing protein [Candidatus Acetothermia bacterium]|nr:right-handed parallel beta-helix repeat-containing protein [Candidatus Acetothermia bacterium]
MLRSTKLFGVGAILVIAVGVAGQGGYLGWTQSCSVTVQPGQSIQQVIDNAPENAVICLSVGVYQEHVEISKPITLRGAGREQTVIKSDNGRSTIRVQGQSEIHVTLSQLTIGYSGGAEAFLVAGKSAVDLSDSGLSHSYYGVRVENEAHLTLTNSQVSDNLGGVSANNEASVSVINSQISNNGGGLVARDAAKLTLQNTQIIGNRGDGLDVSDNAQVELAEAIFEDNRGCAIQVFSQYAQVQGTSSKMQGNDMDLCGYAPTALRKPLVPQTTRDRLAVPDDFKNLQEAVDAIAPGGTINIAAGSYETGITIWKPLTLQGAGRDRTTLKAPSKHNFGISLLGGVDDVVLEGVKITGAEYSGLLLYGQVSLRDVQVSNNGFGLLVRGTAHTTIQNSEVSSNMYDGILVIDSVTLTIQDSLISGNRRDGLSAHSAVALDIQKSVFSRNAIGLELSQKTAVSKIQDSQITHNGAFGLWLLESATAMITNSQISDNGEEGLLIGDQAKVVMEKSQVSANGNSGLITYDQAQLEVRSSTIEKNGSQRACLSARTDETAVCNGVTAYDETRVILNNSVIRNNTDWGVSAYLRQCGYDKDRFTGQMIFQESNTVKDNNTSGNQNGKGNPGSHTFKDLPDGQVCLP